jgi:hypothetical protein
VVGLAILTLLERKVLGYIHIHFHFNLCQVLVSDFFSSGTDYFQNDVQRCEDCDLEKVVASVPCTISL